MNKCVALKNIYKKSKKDPDYWIYENGNLKEAIGIMYKRRGKNSLAYFNIRLFRS